MWLWLSIKMNIKNIHEIQGFLPDIWQKSLGKVPFQLAPPVVSNEPGHFDGLVTPLFR